MSATPGPTTSSSVTADDVDAVRHIAEFREGQLERLQARAEKWIGGLTAITGLLTAAFVVKGPEDFSKLPASAQQQIVALLLLGGVALGIGVWSGYSAAYGSPFASGGLEKVADPRQARVTGTADAWRAAVGDAIKDARRWSQRASVVTILGVLLLAAAVVQTWMTPPRQQANASVCMSGAGGEVIRFGLPAGGRGWIADGGPVPARMNPSAWTLIGRQKVLPQAYEAGGTPMLRPQSSSFPGGGRFDMEQPNDCP